MTGTVSDAGAALALERACASSLEQVPVESVSTHEGVFPKLREIAFNDHWMKDALPDRCAASC
jgi:hypothetical protein